MCNLMVLYDKECQLHNRRDLSSEAFLPLPMVRLLSSKEQGCKDFGKPSKPCHVGIHWIALAQCSQMSMHMLRFHSFFKFFFVSFYIVQIILQQHKG